MSITISTEPDPLHSAYRPIYYEVSSDRYDATANTETVSSIANNGGFIDYTTSSAHNYKVGDIVTPAGFTNSIINNAQTITSVPDTTSIVTDLAWDAAYTGDTGTIERTNDNFQIKGELYVQGPDRIAIISTVNDGLGKLLVTTSPAHGLVLNDYLVIEGTTSYNFTVQVIEVVDTTNFKVALTPGTNQTGTLTKLISQTSRYSSADGGVFKFNFAEAMQSFLSGDIENLATGLSLIAQADNSGKSHMVLFTEQYDDKDGLLQDEDTNFSSTILKSENSTLQHTETQNLNRFIVGSSSQEFLTSAPLTLYINTDEKQQLQFLTNQDQRLKIAYQTYDNTGTPSSTQYSGAIEIKGRRGTAILSGLVDSTISKTDVWLVSVANVQLTEKRTYIRSEKCWKDPIDLYFKNRYGAYDNIRMGAAYKDSGRSKKSTYTKPLDIDFSLIDRGETVINTDLNLEYIAISNTLSENELLWLFELIASSDVYIRSANNLIPIVVTTTKQLIRSRNIQQLEIKYVLSNKLIGN